MTSRQFVLKFAAALFFLVLFTAAFNRLVDPFWYYGNPEIKGFNAIKSRFRFFERDIKPVFLLRAQPDAVIFGSSYSEVGFDPNNPDFTRQGQFKSMNFALAGSHWDMVQCAFEFAIAHDLIKRALVEIAPADMPKADCKKIFPHTGQMTAGELLLSNRAISASVMTVVNQKQDQLSHTPQGLFYGFRGKPGVLERFKGEFAPRPQHMPKCSQTAEPDIKANGPLTPGKLNLSGLEHVITLARQHHIELTLFFIPRHAYAQELDQQCGIQESKWQTIKQAALLVEKSGDKPPALWQFYGFKGANIEPIGVTATYWQDPGHYNYEFGDLMLADMFGTEPPKLGRKVSSKTVDQDYAGYLTGRTEFLKQHPDFQAQLQKLLPQK